MAGWVIGLCLGLYSLRLRVPKSVRSGNGLSIIALCHKVSLLVGMPLRIVKLLLIKVSL